MLNRNKKRCLNGAICYRRFEFSAREIRLLDLGLEGGSLLFLFTNHPPNPNGGVSRRWAGIGRRINRARADFRAEVSTVVIESPVLQRVAPHALNVKERLAERQRL